MLIYFFGYQNWGGKRNEAHCPFLSTHLTVQVVVWVWVCVCVCVSVYVCVCVCEHHQNRYPCVNMASVRGCSHCQHLILSGHNAGTEAKCFLCKRSVPGLLSATVIFMTWQTPLLKALKSQCSCRSRGRAALVAVCMTACAEVGKQLHVLPSHPTLGEPHGFSCRTLKNKQHATKVGKISRLLTQHILSLSRLSICKAKQCSSNVKNGKTRLHSHFIIVKKNKKRLFQNNSSNTLVRAINSFKKPDLPFSTNQLLRKYFKIAIKPSPFSADNSSLSSVKESGWILKKNSHQWTLVLRNTSTNGWTEGIKPSAWIELCIYVKSSSDLMH